MLIQSNFKPAWWLPGAHLQTLYPALLRKQNPPLNVRRERLITPDNDFIDLDWCGEADKPLIILLHGLTGSSASSYIIGLQHTLLKSGLRSVTLNFRGCSGEPNYLARSYHSGDTNDLDFLYETIRQREPATVLAIVGFSIGGNVLLKWLGEKGSNITLDAAVAISVPLLLAECSTRLDQGFAKIYRHNLIQALIRYMQVKQAYLEKIGAFDEAGKIKQLGDLSAIKSFWQYDDQVVSRLYGFNNVHHYYELSSSRQYLRSIKTPTLLIQSLDDPFMTRNVLPSTRQLSSSVTLEVTQKGGHVGFISGTNPFKPEFWLEQRILDFFRQGNTGLL